MAPGVSFSLLNPERLDEPQHGLPPFAFFVYTYCNVARETIMDKTTHIEFMQEIEDRGHAEGCNVLTTSFLRRTKETCTCDRVDTYQAEFDQYAEFRK